ncbi:hypothetical protein VPHD479_0388 [Vibrio phage D479]
MIHLGCRKKRFTFEINYQIVSPVEATTVAKAVLLHRYRLF